MRFSQHGGARERTQKVVNIGGEMYLLLSLVLFSLHTRSCSPSHLPYSSFIFLRTPTLAGKGPIPEVCGKLVSPGPSNREFVCTFVSPQNKP